MLGRILSLTLRSLNIMFNVRRKCVSPGRVAAFIKRLLAITFLLPCHGVIGVLLVIRSFLIVGFFFYLEFLYIFISAK